MQMPVPSSYNDITTSRDLRDHMGGVWYQRSFFAPPSWREQRVFVRFGSVNYLAQVVTILLFYYFATLLFLQQFFLSFGNVVRSTQILKCKEDVTNGKSSNLK